MLDEKVEEKLTPVIENYIPEPLQPYQVEVNEKVETILISKLIDEYIDTVERQKDLREKTILYNTILRIR